MSKLGDNPLNVSISNDVLTISIGVKELCYAVSKGPCADMFEGLTITYAQGFAEDILCELSHEWEDGETMVHRMLDQAAMSAIEFGSESVEIDE